MPSPCTFHSRKMAAEICYDSRTLEGGTELKANSLQMTPIKNQVHQISAMFLEIISQWHWRVRRREVVGVVGTIYIFIEQRSHPLKVGVTHINTSTDLEHKMLAGKYGEQPQTLQPIWDGMGYTMGMVSPSFSWLFKGPSPSCNHVKKHFE